MEKGEMAHIVAAIVLMFVVFATGFAIVGETEHMVLTFIFAIVVVGIPIVVKNAVAYMLDTSVTHEIWNVFHYGVRPRQHFKKRQPFGLYIPLIFSLFSLVLVGILFNGHQVTFIDSAHMFTGVLNTVFWVALAPCCWIVSYLRLREIEV